MPFTALRASSALWLSLSLAALSLRASSRPYDRLTCALLAVISLRILLAIILGVAQVRAARLLASAESARPAGVRALYARMSAYSFLGLGLWVAEAALVGALGGGMGAAAACSACSLGVRAGGSSFPLRWCALLGKEKERWGAHLRARAGTALRCALCVGWCSGKSWWEEGDGRDEVERAAETIAAVLSYRAEGKSHVEAIGTLGKMFFEKLAEKGGEGEAEAEGEREVRIGQAEVLSKAVEMNRYAIAVYTGWLLDVQRYSPLCCLCCWCFSSVPLQRPDLAFPDDCTKPFPPEIADGETSRTEESRKEKKNKDGRINGDNVLGTHRRRIKRYLREKEMVIHSGSVNRGACHVAYCLVSRLGACKGRHGESATQREVVLAIRGTEDIYDILTDLLMESVVLSPKDLGVAQDEETSFNDCGRAHLGALLCARSLVEAVLPELQTVVTLAKMPDQEGSEQPVQISVVGHSLGASVASLVAYMLQPAFISSSAQVKAFAFQPLPVLDKAAITVAEKLHPNAVFSFPFNDDIVSRLSLKRVLKMQRKVILEEGSVLSGSENIAKRSYEKLKMFCFACRFVCFAVLRCFSHGRDQISTVEALGRARALHFESLVEETAGQNDGEYNTPEINEANETNEDQQDGELYLPGRIVHVYKDKESCYKASFCSRYSPALAEIILSKDMFVDHMPWRLSVGLAKVCKATFGSSKRSAEKLRPFQEPIKQTEEMDRETKQDTVVLELV